MRQVKIEKADAGAIREGFSENQNQINAGGIEKRFDVFDFATKTVEKQYCEKCNPHLATKTRRAARIKICADCIAGVETTAAVIFENIAAPRKPERLHRCAGCGNCKASSKFSINYNICKKCLSDNQGKSKLAQSNFINRTLNNLHKNLRGALSNV